MGWPTAFVITALLATFVALAVWAPSVLGAIGAVCLFVFVGFFCALA